MGSRGCIHTYATKETLPALLPPPPLHRQSEALDKETASLLPGTLLQAHSDTSTALKKVWEGQGGGEGLQQTGSEREKEKRL